MHVVSILSSDYFYFFFCKLNLVIFQALLLSTYVDSMYLVRVTPLMNFTFSDDSLFLKKILAGDINSLNLLVDLGPRSFAYES